MFVFINDKKRTMKNISIFLNALVILFILSCGNSSGTDPHLSIEEQQEELEINLVGKWKIRRPISTGLTNKLATPAECSLNEIEFFDDRSYIFSVSVSSDSGEEVKKVYRGNYDVSFDEQEGEQVVSKIVLMQADYTSSSTFPETGSIATLDEIVLSETNVSFRLRFGEGTNDFCLTGEAVNLSGDKEPELAPDAAENSNHQLIQNEWRLVSVLATIEEEQNQEVICRFFEDDFYSRCFDEMTGEFSQDCPQAVTTTLLISGYGTYLFSYFDAAAVLISTEQGTWRWRTDTTAPYTIFDVANEDETFEESNQSIEIVSIDDANMTLIENAEGTDEEGNTFSFSVRYVLQLASLPYQVSECGDFSSPTSN